MHHRWLNLVQKVIQWVDLLALQGILILKLDQIPQPDAHNVPEELVKADSAVSICVEFVVGCWKLRANLSRPAICLVFWGAWWRPG